jgi:tRNA (cmo5U34)-methyltransferase
MTHVVDSATSLGHIPRGVEWSFDESVARVFDDMLRRSIPQHETMRRAVFDIGAEFVVPSTHIVDLGCSRGEALAAFVRTCGNNNSYIGIDTSAPMLEAASARFANEIVSGRLRVTALDLRTGYPDAAASLTLCVLTLQFVPLEYRARVVRDAYRNTVPGGALIVVEKIVGSTPGVSQLMTKYYHAMKAANGYTSEEIERKRLALEGVLVPVTAAANEDMLRAAGFQGVECFWRWMNFAAWVAVKQS